MCGQTTSDSERFSVFGAQLWESGKIAYSLSQVKCFFLEIIF